jgi:hypothetical protein
LGPDTRTSNYGTSDAWPTDGCTSNAIASNANSISLVLQTDGEVPKNMLGPEARLVSKVHMEGLWTVFEMCGQL